MDNLFDRIEPCEDCGSNLHIEGSEFCSVSYPENKMKDNKTIQTIALRDAKTQKLIMPEVMARGKVNPFEIAKAIAVNQDKVVEIVYNEETPENLRESV